MWISISILLDWNGEFLFDNQFLALHITADFIYVPSYYLTSFFVILRIWLIYYDIQFSVSCFNLEWKQCIKNNINTFKKEKWYIEHRSTVGNASFMIKIVICITII
eukprot:95839_1